MANYTNTSPAAVAFAVGDVFNYTCTGNSKTVDLPPGRYLCECWGAQGKNGDAVRGGYGGYAEGVLLLNENTSLHLYVGSQTKRFNNNLYDGSLGGGASDIRLVSGAWENITGLRSRIMVAGGGGGGTVYDAHGTAKGYVNDGLSGGGGLRGLNAPRYGDNLGGTQTSGGKTVSVYYGYTGYPGGFGYGGHNNDTNGGYGGGGYYGGGGSAPTNAYIDGVGAGGSGFISGMEGCDAIDEAGNHTGQPIHYSGMYFTNCAMQTGINAGEGRIRITSIDAEGGPRKHQARIFIF